MLRCSDDDLLTWETKERGPSWNKAYASSLTLMSYYKPRDSGLSNNFGLISIILLQTRYMATPQVSMFPWLAIKRRKGSTYACIQVRLKKIMKIFDFCVYYLLMIFVTTTKEEENNISFGIILVSFMFVSNSHCIHYKRQHCFFWMSHNTTWPVSSSHYNMWEFPYWLQWEIWAISTSEN